MSALSKTTELKINRLKELSEYPKSKRNEELLRQQVEVKEGRITMLEDALKSKEEELTILKNKLKLVDDSTQDNRDMKSTISNQDEPYIKELKEIITRQNRAINEFRGSIVFPFFRLTQNIGRTAFGKKVEKQIKK